MSLTNHDLAETDLFAFRMPLVLQFWAPLCVPCMLMKKSVAVAAEALDGIAEIRFVNVQEDPITAGRFGVAGTPTFVVLQNGMVVARFSGVLSSRALADRVRSALQAGLVAP